jgi:glycosyltransferase involved in cell wall biosynthesis
MPVWSERFAEGGIRHEVRRLVVAARRIEEDGVPFRVVHSHVSYPAGGVAARLAASLRVPHVLSEHMSPFPFPDLLDRTGRITDRVLIPLRSADVVTAVSSAHARQIFAMTSVAPIVIPNFIDGAFFTPAFEPPRQIRRFIAVGHLVPQKGVDILLQAFALARRRHPELRLSIVGDGRERAALESLAHALALADAVEFLGAPTRQRLAALYREADAFVLASRHESFGVVVVEAMASGLPSVVTQCGGPEEIIDEDSGIVVPPESPELLADALLDMTRMQWDRVRIRQRFEERYSARAVTGRLVPLYKQIAARSAPVPQEETASVTASAEDT